MNIAPPHRHRLIPPTPPRYEGVLFQWVPLVWIRAFSLNSFALNPIRIKIDVSNENCTNSLPELAEYMIQEARTGVPPPLSPAHPTPSYRAAVPGARSNGDRLI